MGCVGLVVGGLNKSGFFEAEFPAGSVADDDVIDHKHSVLMFESIPQARLAVMPGTSHQANKEKPEMFQMFIREFLANLDYPETKMPMRRA